MDASACQHPTILLFPAGRLRTPAAGHYCAQCKQRFTPFDPYLDVTERHGANVPEGPVLVSNRTMQRIADAFEALRWQLLDADRHRNASGIATVLVQMVHTAIAAALLHGLDFCQAWNTIHTREEYDVGLVCWCNRARANCPVHRADNFDAFADFTSGPGSWDGGAQE